MLLRARTRTFAKVAAFLLINSVGWSLAFRSELGLILTLLLIPPVLARINAEEKLLHAQFGDKYNAYCSHTWRLIPGLYQ